MLREEFEFGTFGTVHCHPRPDETMLWAQGLKVQLWRKWYSLPLTGNFSLLASPLASASASSPPPVSLLLAPSSSIARVLALGLKGMLS